MKVTTCRKCPARIIWTETAETRGGGAGGKRMPVDAVPSDRGNIYLDDGRIPPSEVVYSIVRPGAILRSPPVELDTPLAFYVNAEGREALAAIGVPLYVSHFATCPNAEQFRKKGTTP